MLKQNLTFRIIRGRIKPGIQTKKNTWDWIWSFKRRLCKTNWLQGLHQWATATVSCDKLWPYVSFCCCVMLFPCWKPLQQGDADGTAVACISQVWTIVHIKKTDQSLSSNRKDSVAFDWTKEMEFAVLNNCRILLIMWNMQEFMNKKNNNKYNWNICSYIRKRHKWEN